MVHRKPRELAPWAFLRASTFSPRLPRDASAPSLIAMSSTVSDLKHDLQYAIDLARAAGKIVLEQYGKVARLTKTHIATKEEAVTEADRASQRASVAGLRRRFSGDGSIREGSDTGESNTSDC